jgi:hypothetical protein
MAVSTGWFAAGRSIAATCCSSRSGGLFKGVSGGVYWADHLKTEATVAAPGTTEGYGNSSEPLANGSDRFTDEVDEAGVRVKPATRMPERSRLAALDQIERIERHQDHVSVGKYAGLGGAIGAAVLLLPVAGV